MYRLLSFLLLLAYAPLPMPPTITNIYWVGGCTNTNWDCISSTTTNWSLSSGGANNTSTLPGPNTNVIYDSNSGSGNSVIHGSTQSVEVYSLTCPGTPGLYTGTISHTATQVQLYVDTTLDFRGCTYQDPGPYGSQPVAALLLCSSGVVVNYVGTCTLYTGGNLMADINMCGNAPGTCTVTLGDNLNFDNYQDLIFKTDAQLHMNGHNINGYSATSRILFRQSSLGTNLAAVVYPEGGTASYVDVEDQNFTTATDWSGITGGCGDAGNNTNLTATAPTTQHWLTAAGGNVSNPANWTSRIPLPQDTLKYDAAFSSGAIVIQDMPTMGKDIDWSGATWTGTAPIWNFSVSYHNTNNLHWQGNMTLVTGLTVEVTAAGGASIINECRFHSICTLKSAGVQWCNPGGCYLGGNSPGNTVQQQDDLSIFGQLGQLRITGGGWDANNHNVTTALVGVGGCSGADACTINMGSGTWRLGENTYSEALAIWGMVSGVTINPGTSTILIDGSETNAGAWTFDLHGYAYNKIVVNNPAASPGTLAFLNGGTIANFDVVAGSVQIQHGTTVATTYAFLNGASGSLSTIASDSSGNQGTITTTQRYAWGDYVTVQDISFSPKWYAGAHSTCVSDLTNVVCARPKGIFPMPGTIQ